MAVGGILTMPATAQAATSNFESSGWQNWKEALDCKGLSNAHITSSGVDVVDGLLTVTVAVQFASEQGDTGGAVYVCEEEWEPVSSVGDGKTYYDFLTLESSAKVKKFFGQSTESTINGSKASYKFIFEGLTVGKTYYVYCQVADSHGEGEAIYEAHYAVCLGSGVPTATSAPGSSSSGSSNAAGDAYTRFENDLASQIEEAPSGSTVVVEEGVSALSNSTMKELLAKGDVSLKMEFTYQDKEYVIIIPAGAALDNDIPWYGPLYLAQHFGNSAGTNGTYEVKSGDSLSRIAAASNMTLQQLLAKNPQIKDPNKIIVGQKINR